MEDSPGRRTEIGSREYPGKEALNTWICVLRPSSAHDGVSAPNGGSGASWPDAASLPVASPRVLGESQEAPGLLCFAHNYFAVGQSHVRDQIIVGQMMFVAPSADLLGP